MPTRPQDLYDLIAEEAATYKKRTGEDYTPNMLNTMKAAFRSFYRHLVGIDAFARSPAESLRIRKQGPQHP